MKVAVVGGGPGGLVTLKFLATAHHFFDIPPLEVRLYEAEDEIGGTFVARVYEDAEMVSSKYLTAFSDFRLPASAPDFVTPAAYVQYLRDYLSHFQLWPHVRCRARVTRITRSRRSHHHPDAGGGGGGGGGHTVEIFTSTETGGATETWDCDAVAICTGMHVLPRIPALPGLERVKTVLHSSEVKTRAQLGEGTHVVVLGAGETGMDMAHLAVTAPTASVTLCHRGGFFCAPKIIPVPTPRGRPLPAGARPNKPVDTSVASLFDTAYAHPRLQRSSLLWAAYDFWVRKAHWCISGTEEGPDQWVGQMSKERKHLDSLFMVKSDRALPYLSANHRSTSLLNRLRMRILNVPLRPHPGRTISVQSWPSHIDSSGNMHFQSPPSSSSSSSSTPLLSASQAPPPPPPSLIPDVVILATGYITSFPILDHGYPSLSSASVRGIYDPSCPSVGFIGFVRPSIGAIPPLAELQAQLWVLRLLQHQEGLVLQPPPSPSPSRGSSQSAAKKDDDDAVQGYEMDWRLHPRAGYDVWVEKRGVDHESYAYQLALDMGAAPTWRAVARRGWRCAYTWAMGSNFNTKFRLVGPWRDEAVAEDIMKGELYEVVRRSGGLVYFLTYTLIPLIVFGTISLSLHAAYGIAALPGKAAAGVRRASGCANGKTEVAKTLE
ncbi:dimethylaniline monooxygenase [Beauveria bassiana ARSEF 2860]|uniref:Dimethylaniline monooxygenase n=1 Tax=Beauveria bassiana (strain ARSEF 2860) TaxID=655819 RepID=J5JJT6_BEAB2|nr:dimethylaniline monooxygenase [Beauveria bassiana ARSEF 2860]EJP63556.1 dimethylaniline monooxygenase [Beauveria bassiana ARSEF 2860]